MICILWDILADKIVNSKPTLINKMHHTRESSCYLCKGGNIEKTLVSERGSSIGNILFSEVSKRFGVKIMGAVSDSQDTTHKSTIELVVIDLVVN